MSWTSWQYDTIAKELAKLEEDIKNKKFEKNTYEYDWLIERRDFYADELKEESVDMWVRLREQEKELASKFKEDKKNLENYLNKQSETRKRNERKEKLKRIFRRHEEI